MKKFLLLLALILGATCAYAQEDVVTETFGSWFKPTSKPRTYTVAENVSPQTDITYQSTYAYYYTQESTLMLCKGTSTNTRGTIWFSLSYPISKITVHTGKNSSVSGKITVSASTNSGESYNDISVSLAIDKKDADFEITIPTEYQAAGTFYKIAQTTNNNTQVASLSYTKVITGPRTLGDLTASYGSKTIASDDVVTFDQGTSISFHADNATSFVINETEILEAVDGTATWTPAVCENTAISVVAKREIEGEETQTSDALTFTLTVKKPDSITAQWVVTGAGNATNNVVDLNLQLDDNSDNGQWHAYCGNSYSGTISGGAQLGSGAKPFNNGTISLIESDIPENAIIKEITFNGFTNDTYTLAVTVNGVSAGNISVNQSTAKDHTLSNLNLVGNQIVFTATSATKYLCVKGISVKYTIPEEEVQLGEITASYNAGFSMDEDTESELYVMAGTEITFSSENAAMMEITSSDEGINLPESVNASSISCEIPEGVFALTVNAFSEDKKQSTGKTFTIMGEEVTPAKPSIANHNTDAKEVTFSTEAGALMIMIAPEQPAAYSPMRIEAQDWTFTPDPKSHTIDYSNLVDEVMLVSVKSVTPKAESEPYVMRLSSDGDVSGIEGVEAGASNGKAVYYNLQGQLVDATRPGLYIRCQGGRAEKVLVR